MMELVKVLAVFALELALSYAVCAVIYWYVCKYHVYKVQEAID